MISVPLFAQMSKEEMQDMYLTYLKGRNIEARVDEDGDIEFEYELPTYNPLTFYIIVHEDDQELFQILNPGFYPLETAQEKSRAPLAASYATIAAITMRVFTTDDGTDVIASAEVYLASPQNFRFVFPKMILQFEKAFDEFIERME
jgi:hypothetical protein